MLRDEAFPTEPKLLQAKLPLLSYRCIKDEVWHALTSLRIVVLGRKDEVFLAPRRRQTSTKTDSQFRLVLDSPSLPSLSQGTIHPFQTRRDISGMRCDVVLPRIAFASSTLAWQDARQMALKARLGSECLLLRLEADVEVPQKSWSV